MFRRTSNTTSLWYGNLGSLGCATMVLLSIRILGVTSSSVARPIVRKIGKRNFYHLPIVTANTEACFEATTSIWWGTGDILGGKANTKATIIWRAGSYVQLQVSIDVGRYIREFFETEGSGDFCKAWSSQGWYYGTCSIEYTDMFFNSKCRCTCPALIYTCIFYVLSAYRTKQKGYIVHIPCIYVTTPYICAITPNSMGTQWQWSVS